MNMYSKIIFNRTFSALPLLCCGVLIFFGMGPLLPGSEAATPTVYAQDTINPETLISAIDNAPEVSGFAFPGCGGELVDAADLEAEQRVAELVNQARATAGLPPMKLVAGLSNAARYHAADMTADDYFEHDSYDRINGTLVKICDWFQRIQAYYPSPRAENIAWGYQTPASVMHGWMNSSGHRANILGNAREMGVGLYERRWVQDFGSRSDVYPLIINGEAATTESAQVALYIYGQWDEIRLRNNGVTWSDWMPFQNSMTWHINAVPGKHIVEVEMRNNDLTVASSDSIDYVGPAEPTPEASPTVASPATVPPTATSTATSTAVPTSSPTATAMPSSTPSSTPITEPTATSAASTATQTPIAPTETLTETPTDVPLNRPIATPTNGVNEPHLQGRVALEGRPPMPHPHWSIPLQIHLADAASGAVLSVFNVTTTDSGEFSTPAVEPDTYLVAVKGQNTLQRVTKIEVDQGGMDQEKSDVDMGLLSAGDIHVDNMINLRDFSFFRRAYGRCIANSSADLDGNSCVDQQDLRLLIHNFGLVGETLDGNPPYAQIVSAADLDPLPEPPPVDNKVSGQRFTLAILASGPSGSPIDAGAFYLNFDPTKLQIVEVVKGGAFDVLLDQQINNETGQVDFAVGALGTPATTPAIMALLLIEAVDDMANPPFVFAQEEMRSSELLYDGQSLMTNTRTAEQVNLSWQEVTLDQHLFLPLVNTGQ